jgi:acyl-CoA thioester hydrolase
MYEYSRAVYYYETDKMGVVHHSNYVRWMEEARDFFFNEADLAYTVTESYGVMCPVTDISVKFKHFAAYGDVFTVRVSMTKYTGVRFRMAYSIINQDGTVLAEGESGHGFIDSNYKPVALSRRIPQRHELMLKLMEEG